MLGNKKHSDVNKKTKVFGATEKHLFCPCLQQQGNGFEGWSCLNGSDNLLVYAKYMHHRLNQKVFHRPGVIITTKSPLYTDFTKHFYTVALCVTLTDWSLSKSTDIMNKFRKNIHLGLFYTWHACKYNPISMFLCILDADRILFLFFMWCFNEINITILVLGYLV